MAWAVLLLASGHASAADDAAGQARYRSRVRQWLRDHPLAQHARALRARAQPEEFDAHPSEIVRILERPDVLITGISSGDLVGLVGGSAAAEVYAPVGRRSALVKEHALAPGPGPVRVRWVPDALWPLLARDQDRRAPRAAVLVDLLEHHDPRARREAARALSS